MTRLENGTLVKVALTLVICGALGGSSFILIKALVGHISPVQLVAARIALATAVLVPAMLALKRTPPLNATVLRGAAVLAVMDAIAPYMLVASAAPYALASTAALLASTMPLFTGVIVSVADRSRLPLEYIAGLLLGAVGVSILAGPRAFDFGSSEMLAMLAVLMSAFCLASSAVYSRHLLRVADPIGLSAIKFAIASCVIVPVVTLREGIGGYADLSAAGWLGLLAVGFITTGVGRCGYVWVIAKAGSVSASLLTYIVPVAALLLAISSWARPWAGPGASEQPSSAAPSPASCSAQRLHNESSASSCSLGSINTTWRAKQKFPEVKTHETWTSLRRFALKNLRFSSRQERQRRARSPEH